MDPLPIRFSDGVMLAVPPRLNSLTTYILLEQETWFEKELPFLRHWLKPGMTAIDIGANLGIYTLSMAHLVGAQGHIFAYEPGSEARGLLTMSREINRASQIEISPVALSDQSREGRLVFGHSSELHALGSGSSGELVQITSLDEEDSAWGWQSIDFIKIDAEGEEERILAGGQRFFAQHSPLVMFEIKAGAKENHALRDAFPAIGYALFRLLPGAAILVVVDPEFPLDPYELNLFAAKPDRVKAMREDNLIAYEDVTFRIDDTMRQNALKSFLQQTFASIFSDAMQNFADLDSNYREALGAFGIWRNTDQPASQRYSALMRAYELLAQLCNTAPTLARFSTFARVCFEAGQRGEGVMVLRELGKRLRQENFSPTEPCWPADQRFDHLAGDANPALWFAGAVGEQLEKMQSFSTAFTSESPLIDWLCQNPFASTEMHRRRVLLAARAGANPLVPNVLRKEGPNHLNAALWASCKVPGTRVK